MSVPHAVSREEASWTPQDELDLQRVGLVIALAVARGNDPNPALLALFRALVTKLDSLGGPINWTRK